MNEYIEQINILVEDFDNGKITINELKSELYKLFLTYDNNI